MPIAVPIKPVRVRIAPSPTGDPHVGTGYIGLFNQAFARHHGGQFVLRIEDTDQKRSTLQSEQMIYKSLAWLGLRWDEGPDVGGPFGPYRQSERGAIYAAATQTLLDNGTAYRCFCSAERLDAIRQDQRDRKETPRYDGFCRDLDREQSRLRAEAGQTHVVRLRMRTDGESIVADALRGDVAFDNKQIDDQVLLKSDGLPTYHLANVVDDHHMHITHVIRAEEWLNSTPKHLALYEAFGWEPPVFVHMPLLRNADKSKISKRKNPTSLEFYQRAGILPEAMLNFLGLMGYSRKDEAGNDLEKFSLQEFTDDLDLTRISLGGPVFDLRKLDWLNGLYLRTMTPEVLVERCLDFLREDERYQGVARLVQERLTSLGDFLHHAEPFFESNRPAGLAARHFLVGSGSRKKTAIKLNREQSQAFFEDCVTRLEGLLQWSHDAIDAALRQAVAQAGVQVGDGLMAVRVAIAGRPAAPPLFETVEVVGRALTLHRLRQVANWLADPQFLEAEIAAASQELAAAQLALHGAAPE